MLLLELIKSLIAFEFMIGYLFVRSADMEVMLVVWKSGLKTWKEMDKKLKKEAVE